VGLLVLRPNDRIWTTRRRHHTDGLGFFNRARV
jgi:hypothetical protein